MAHRLSCRRCNKAFTADHKSARNCRMCRRPQWTRDQAAVEAQRVLIRLGYSAELKKLPHATLLIVTDDAARATLERVGFVIKPGPTGGPGERVALKKA